MDVTHNIKVIRERFHVAYEMFGSVRVIYGSAVKISLLVLYCFS